MVTTIIRGLIIAKACDVFKVMSSTEPSCLNLGRSTVKKIYFSCGISFNFMVEQAQKHRGESVKQGAILYKEAELFSLAISANHKFQ